MSELLTFNDENDVILSSEEVLSIIDKEKKVTVILDKGFKRDSDTEDVFRGLVGDIAFEESVVFMDALDWEGEVSHLFFLCNDIEETPFNERGMTKRLIKDNYWTSLLLHDHPLKDGRYAVIKNANSNITIDN